jgi:hypothetical protein
MICHYIFQSKHVKKLYVLLSRLADKLWQDVDPKDFACKPEIRVPQSVVFSQPGANVTLSCFIIGTPMPDAKWVLKVRIMV